MSYFQLFEMRRPDLMGVWEKNKLLKRAAGAAVSLG